MKLTKDLSLTEVEMAVIRDLELSVTDKFQINLLEQLNLKHEIDNLPAGILNHFSCVTSSNFKSLLNEHPDLEDVSISIYNYSNLSKLAEKVYQEAEELKNELLVLCNSNLIQRIGDCELKNVIMTDIKTFVNLSLSYKKLLALDPKEIVEVLLIDNHIDKYKECLLKYSQGKVVKLNSLKSVGTIFTFYKEAIEENAWLRLYGHSVPTKVCVIRHNESLSRNFGATAVGDRAVISWDIDSSPDMSQLSDKILILQRQGLDMGGSSGIKKQNPVPVFHSSYISQQDEIKILATFECFIVKMSLLKK